jgi:hypothetical protein
MSRLAMSRDQKAAGDRRQKAKIAFAQNLRMRYNGWITASFPCWITMYDRADESARYALANHR